MKPIVALVGRPNVGKSSLFNKLAGIRIAIVEDTPGVTRDRIYAEASWSGNDFTIIDTAGLEPPSKSETNMLRKMREQTEVAIATAHVIVFVVDSQVGLTADDIELGKMLKKSNKPVVIACNKSESTNETKMMFYEFYQLGFSTDPIAISAIHGTGTGDLLDEIVKNFKDIDTNNAEEEDTVKIAIVGKPNAGKSSLINKILGKERHLVSEVAGTTRDSIDSLATWHGIKFTLIDTAGMRKRGRVEEDIERYSVMRSLAAIERANVTLLMIDATEGISEQDTKIAGYAHDNGKAMVIAVNKWDAVEKDDKSQNEFKASIYNKLPFATYAPVIFISALTGQKLDKVFETALFVHEKANLKVSTSALNEIIIEATNKQQPPSDKGKRLKIYYGTQTGVCPPTFTLFVNDGNLMHFSYTRFIENQIRSIFGFEGTPLKIFSRDKK